MEGTGNVRKQSNWDEQDEAIAGHWARTVLELQIDSNQYFLKLLEP